MSLRLLFKDELTGFYRSNVMLILWIGMPIVTIILYLWSPVTSDEMPLSVFFASMISSLGGSLAAIMITVHLVHEKSRHVYELFLVRPVKRRDILISKFLAVFTCVASACAISLLFGLTVDFLKNGALPDELIKTTFDSFLLSIFTMASSCAAGVLIGVISPSVLVGIILIMFVMNNVTSLALLLPLMLKQSYSIHHSVILSIIISVIFLITAVSLFNKKQF